MFDAITVSADRLVGDLSTSVWRFEGDKGFLAAFTPTNPTADEALKALSPMRNVDFDLFDLLSQGKIVQRTDTEEGPPQIRNIGRMRGFRSILSVPLMAQRVAIGFVSVTRKEPGAFEPEDVQLLQTFADQAVIDIENTRLFEAEQASKRELQESLEYQTATSGVLGVISRAPSKAEPVFDEIVKSASRLCRWRVCNRGALRRRDAASRRPT